jgi:hypothetical protein
MIINEPMRPEVTFRRAGLDRKQTAFNVCPFRLLPDKGASARTVPIDDGGMAPALSLVGIGVRAFPSGKAFLESTPALVSGCVVLDIHQPDAGGPIHPERIQGPALF